MQEKGSLQLFEDLHTLLQEFVKNYLADHTNPLTIETHCLNKLKSIASELGHFLRDKSSSEKFTFDKYETFILRIESVKPPQEITKTQKSTGFLGIIGASESSEKVTVGLHNAMNRLITNLTTKAVEAKAKVKETLEKTPSSEKKFISEEKNVPNEIELFKQQMAQQMAVFDQRLSVSEKNAYEKGRKEEREEIIKRVQRYLNGPQQQEMLLLLNRENPVEANTASSSSSTGSTSSTSAVMNSTNSASSAVPVVFATVPEIKEDTQEAKEAKKSIGNAKFEPIKQLVTFYNSGNASEQEKIIVRWLNFELMLHKYNQPISSIFDGVKTQLSAQCNLNIADFSNLYRIFKTNLQNHDTVTTQALRIEELIEFYTLTGESAIYLPKDITASNCFGTQAARLEGQKVELFREEHYIKNAITKLNGLVKSASMPQPQ